MHSKYPTIKQLQEFDFIVAIARGGLVPAFLVANMTNIRSVDTLICQSYSDDHIKSDIIYTSKDYSHLTGKRVLIVDELVVSGDSLEFAYNKIKEWNPSQIKTFVVFRKDCTKFEPDYYLEDRSNQWIYFHYDDKKIEDIISYITK